MEFRYSTVVDRHLYETDDLINDIPFRVHKDYHKDINGCLRAQRDWKNHVGPISEWYGGIGDSWSFVAATMPECLPERLEVISYANEFAFLYDDVLEELNLDDAQNKQDTNEGFLATFNDKCFSDQTAWGLTGKGRPEMRLQAQIFAEMMVIDPERARTAMKAWAKCVQLTAKTRETRYETLAEYVPARNIDAGELFWFGLLTFGMGLTIPESEYKSCMEMASSGYAVLGLTNDLYSWDKEAMAAKEAGNSDVFNAIWVIMRENTVDEEHAKIICRQEIKSYLSKFVDQIDKAKRDSIMSTDIRLYLEALLYSCIGNLVWSMSAPRYYKIQ
ncbi:terpene cyclase [Neopestalotiopsis sp. 37M]|nr:terpene cyclase [Neopestalotiopsis sp. 37M]